MHYSFLQSKRLHVEVIVLMTPTCSFDGPTADKRHSKNLSHWMIQSDPILVKCGHVIVVVQFENNNQIGKKSQGRERCQGHGASIDGPPD